MDTGHSLFDMHKFHRAIDDLNWQFGGEKMQYNFLARSEFLPHAVVYRTGEISRLETALRDDLKNFVVESQLGAHSLDHYIHIAPVNGLIILQHGRILFESYPRMRPFDKHLFMSVTKAYVCTLIGLLEARGQLDRAQPVERYLPELSGSGWQGATLRDVLEMASGIDAPEIPEAFDNPDLPYYQYEASLGWLPATAATLLSTYSYVASLKRKDPPGLAFEYTSVNTFLLAWIVERLTSQPLHEILAAEVWSKIGAQADGLIAISKYGAPAAHAGLFATLRDLARFGLLFTPSWPTVSSQAVIPPSYLHAIQTGGRAEIFDRGPTGAEILAALRGEHPKFNSYHWDYVMDDGDFYKGGYGGQGLYISPGRDLVIAYFGVPFDEKMESHDLQAISRQMVKSGLFDG